jgi:hypothetical protein
VDDEQRQWQGWSERDRMWIPTQEPESYRKHRLVVQRWHVRLGQWVTGRVLEEHCHSPATAKR